MTGKILKTAALALAVFALSFCLFGCGASDNSDSGKIKVIATVFPGYDFARSVCGDAAEVTLLIPPGSESHSYEPSARDISAIAECDLFIYTGGESDTWIEGILSSLGGEIRAFSMMDCVELIENDGEDGHSDGDGHSHLDADYDEHVWTSPVNAIKIAEGICREVSAISEENRADFEENTASLVSELTALDRDFRALFASAEAENGDITLVFGDRFPLRYFTEEYGLGYVSAFPGCSHETEVSVAKMSYLVDFVKEENIKTVFYMDFSNHVIADSIGEATGAGVKRLYSCHNVSKEQFDGGATYVSLMRENLAVLAEALN